MKFWTAVLPVFVLVTLQFGESSGQWECTSNGDCKSNHTYYGYCVLNTRTKLPKCEYLKYGFPQCKAKDTFDKYWVVPFDFTGVQDCPNGWRNGSLSEGFSTWKCNGTLAGFVDETRDYSSCRSRGDWVQNVADEIQDWKIPSHYTALEFTKIILTNLMESQSHPKNPTFFGKDIKPILTSLEMLSARFIPSDRGEDNLELVEESLKSLQTILDCKNAWMTLPKETRSHTFWDTIKLMEKIPDRMVQKTCTGDGSTCNFPLQFKDGTTFNKISDDNSLINFPEEPSRSSVSLSTRLSRNDGKFYVGKIINHQYIVDYTNSEFETADSTYRTNSDAISFSVIDAKIEKLTTPVEIKFNHFALGWGHEQRIIQRNLHEGESGTAVLGTSQCVFWNVHREQWNDTGCIVLETTNSYTLCSCDHLTTFSEAAKLHRYIGKSPFLVFLVLSLFVFLTSYWIGKLVFQKYFPQEDDFNELSTKTEYASELSSRNYGLSLSCLCYGVIFFFVDKHFFYLSNLTCYRVGILGHFLVLWIVSMMTVDNIESCIVHLNFQNLKCVIWFGKQSPCKAHLLVPAIVAAIFVLPVVSFNMFASPLSWAYGGEFCWLAGSYIWTLYIPMWILLLLNVVSILYVAYSTKDSVMINLPTTNLYGQQVNPEIIINFVKSGLLANVAVFVTWIIALNVFTGDFLDHEVMVWVLPFLIHVQGMLLDDLMGKNKGFKAFLKRQLLICIRKKCLCKKGQAKSYDVKERCEEDQQKLSVLPQLDKKNQKSNN